MKRFQSARSISSFTGDSLGFLGRKRRRRRRPVRSADRQLERVVDEEPASLIRLPRVPSSPTPKWGPLTRLGEQLRVQARQGYRAAVVELKPGMYLVAEIPESALQPGIGVIPLLAPLLTMAAQKALKKRGRRRQEQPEVIYEPPPPRQLTTEAPARWMDAGDFESARDCGCDGRSYR